MVETVRDSGERPLTRMRQYTTISLVAVFAMYAVLTVVASPTPWVMSLTGVAALLTAVQASFWEKGPPLWLGALTSAAALAAWCVSIATQSSPLIALVLGAALGLPVAVARNHRLWWALAGLAVVVVPVLAAIIVKPEVNWSWWLVAAVAAYVASAGLFMLNTYAFNLYLEIDAARRTSAELAVAQERYRFAADLHDIQGHTLHVIRLKTQLARRLIDRDPDAAREHLAEAEELINETLSNTRSLAFGDRRVDLASELANARELFLAADVRWTVTGSHTAGVNEELFGLVVRESTTNILRHAQATSVTVTLEPHRITIANDGSPATVRAPRGLARLAERFESVGGRLSTTLAAGIFTTEPSVP